MLPSLNFIILCDKVNLTQNGKIDILGVFDDISAPNFPARHKEMFVLTEAMLDKGEYQEILKIDFNGQEKELARSSVKKEEKGKHLFVHQITEMIFPDRGDYFAKIYINDILVGTRKFSLRNES